MSALQAKYSAAIEAAIAKAFDGAECYAYPHKQGCIAFGVNAAKTGVNILRGVRRPDGVDEAVT
jgi:hypothetical protein